MLFGLELVRAEEFETTAGFLVGETALGTLEELEHVLHDNGLEVDFLLVVQVLGAKLNGGHVDLGVYSEMSICAHGPRKIDTYE